MKNIRAVFWDIDGTIVMSESIHDAKMRHIAAVHGIAITEDAIASFQGIGDPRVHEIFQNLGYAENLETYLKECDDFYFSNLDGLVVREGFAQAFALFEAHGVLQSAVSNGTKPLVDANLLFAGVTEKMVAIVDLDYVMDSGLLPKPAADPYTEALCIVNEKTGADIQPDECLVIEDSPVGVLAGKAAGMTSIFWMLEPGRTAEGADYSAFSAKDLSDIISPLLSGTIQA